jgi:hypothetical protein
MNNIIYTPEYFMTLAKDIMIRHKLVIKQNFYKICDIEFYLDSSDHQDIYTPSLLNDMLKNSLQIDNDNDKVYLCLENNEENIKLGLLIRALYDCASGNVIEGKRCFELIREQESLIIDIFNGENNIYLDIDLHPDKKIIKTGMRIIQEQSDDLFKNKNYRFATEWSKLKKKVIKYIEPIKTDKNIKTEEKFIYPENITDQDEIELLRKIWNIKRKFEKNEIIEKNKVHYTTKLNELTNKAKKLNLI